MKIAVNTRLLLKGRLDGIGWFTFETLKRIVERHPEHQYYFLFDRPWDPSFIFSPQVKPVLLRPPARHPVLWFLWLEFSVHRFLKKHTVDLYLSPDGYLPLRSNIPSLAVIHDINFFHRPADLPPISRWYYNTFFPVFTRKAKRIATVSNYSATDIATSYGIDRKKIDVCYNGVNEAYGLADAETIRKTRDWLTGGDPYFLFIGTLHPRKNVDNLLLAYDLFRESHTNRIPLVIVGEKFFMTRNMEAIHRRMKHAEDVIFPGRLDPDVLKQVLGSGLAMTFVPYFEGFGIPVVEAMRSGLPVVCSNVTSLPEVGGDAVLYANPQDPEDIAKQMILIATDKEIRQACIEKGLKQATKFHWDNTASLLWESMLKTVNDA